MVTSEFELTLNNPLTDEEWDMLTDADLDKTDRIMFETKHGKHVEFAKVIRCKDCANRYRYSHCYFFGEEEYCAWSGRKGKEE